MIEQENGGYTKVDLTDEETEALLKSRGIPYKFDSEGHPVAVDYGNRAENRRSRFGSSWKDNS